MPIIFYTEKDFCKTLKATIHKTGRLGFTGLSAEEMKLDTSTYFIFGKEESIDADLIMAKVKTEIDGAFRVTKAGEYYYLPTTSLFDMLEYNYRQGSIIFDVKRYPSLDAEAGGEVYTLKRRPSKGRRPKMVSSEDD